MYAEQKGAEGGRQTEEQPHHGIGRVSVHQLQADFVVPGGEGGQAATEARGETTGDVPQYMRSCPFFLRMLLISSI